MYGISDGKGDINGRYIKSSSIDEKIGYVALNRKIERDLPDLKKLDTRKSLAKRISKAIEELKSSGQLTVDALTSRLKKDEIVPVFRFNGSGRLTGVTYIDNREFHVYKGSNLGKELSANELNKLFNEYATRNKGEEQDTDKIMVAEDGSLIMPQTENVPSPQDDQSQPDVADDESEEHPKLKEETETVEQEKDFSIFTEGFGLFEDLPQGEVYEEIDPQFKRKKKKKRKIKR